MAMYPEVQKKAQEELDLVLGPGLLPTLKDRPRLPYMEALLLEILRFHPIGPMGRFILCTRYLREKNLDFSRHSSLCLT